MNIEFPRTCLIGALILFAFGLSGCGGPVVTSEMLLTASMAPEVPPHVSPAGAAQAGEYTLPTYGLPIAYYTLSIAVDKDCKATIKLGDKPVYVRDPKYNFALNYKHGLFTTDTITVQTDGQGLLMAVNTTSENQTLAILNKAFELAANVGKFAFTEGSECALHSGDFLFDPLDKDKRDDIRRKTGISLSEPVPLDGYASVRNSTPRDERYFRETPCIYFRVNRMYRMDALADDRSLPFIFAAPDTSVTYAIPMVRKDFVKFDVKLKFDHGVLNSFDFTDPSQALAVIQIPADIVKGILGLASSGSKK